MSRELLAGSSCVVSVASIWEVAIKHRLGKLPVPPRRFRDEMRSAGAFILSVSDEHALATADLPIAHGDPFDRLLIGAAQVEQVMQGLWRCMRDLGLPRGYVLYPGHERYSLGDGLVALPVEETLARPGDLVRL